MLKVGEDHLSIDSSFVSQVALSAAGATEVSAGDTSWVLVSAALVMVMTPALAFFYGGMVRQKNVLATIMQSFVIIAVISVQWVLWGYTLAFGPDVRGLIGNLDWIGLNGVGLTPNPDYAATIPHQAFMIFQGMFAVITPALITGAFAERMKFRSFLFFVLLWATLVYDPVAHWMWGQGGWLRALGAVDFAGGVVVHITSGFAALAAALIMKKRIGLEEETPEPHDSTMIVLGAALLWFGWFGFNAGSAAASGALATSAFVATNTAAAMAALAWMTMSWWMGGKPSVIGTACGAIAGLAAVTPAAGYITPLAALIIGLVAGVLCYLACHLKARSNFVDDSLDVMGVHGVGGVWGTLAAGLFASVAINAAGPNGLFNGNPQQLGVQLLAIVATATYSFVLTAGILKAIDFFFGLRVAPNEELHGLDLTQHGEAAYGLPWRRSA